MAYATLAEVRALDGLSTDLVNYPDAAITEGINYATELIDAYCGPMEPKNVVLRLAPETGSTAFYTGVPGLRSVVSAVADGTSLTTTAWKVDPDGWVYPSVYLGSYYVLVLTVSASPFDTVPEGVKWAARTLARQYVLDLRSRTPDRATSVQTEMGTIQMAQAGGPGRPTSLPDVNAVLNRYGAKPRVTA